MCIRDSIRPGGQAQLGQHGGKDHPDMIHPVSYTHLDVYKRQLQIPGLIQGGEVVFVDRYAVLAELAEQRPAPLSGPKPSDQLRARAQWDVDLSLIHI